MNIRVAKHNSVRREPAWVWYIGFTERVGLEYDKGNRALHVLANHRTGPVGNLERRTELVNKYRKNLWAKIQAKDPRVMAAIDQLLAAWQESNRLTLVCHCINTNDTSGNYCHCQVLARALSWLKEKENAA